MNYGDFKRKVLMEIGEFSANGAQISELANKDYILSMIDATNLSLTQIVTISGSNKGKHFIAQRNPKNGLGKLWEKFRYDGTEKTFSLDKARAYSFQLGGSFTVYIEEYITGAWTNIDTIVHAHTASDGYVSYKGNVTKTNNDNPLRLRFTSLYNALYRWIYLSTEYLEFPVSYEPQVEYNLPTDLYQLESVNLLMDDGSYVEYPDKMYEQSGKILILPYETEGEFRIDYIKYPVHLIYDEDNLTINDTTELDILDEFMPSLINDVAGKLKANVDKKYTIGDRYSGISIDATNAAISRKQKKSIETPIKGSRWY